MNISPDTLLNRGWSYKEETFGEVHSRYNGFGIGIYRSIEEEFPKLFRKLRFYQSNVHQSEDSYAVCEVDPPFSIQLDPDCEIIVLGSKTIHIEIGDWSPNPCQEAVDFIREHFNV